MLLREPLPRGHTLTALTLLRGYHLRLRLALYRDINRPILPRGHLHSLVLPLLHILITHLCRCWRDTIRRWSLVLVVHIWGLRVIIVYIDVNIDWLIMRLLLLSLILLWLVLVPIGGGHGNAWFFWGTDAEFIGSIFFKWELNNDLAGPPSRNTHRQYLDIFINRVHIWWIIFGTAIGGDRLPNFGGCEAQKLIV